MTAGRPSTEAEMLREAIGAIRPLDEEAMAAARSRQERLTKPRGSLGRLEALSVQLAGIQGTPLPHVAHPAVVVAAADHGVAAEGVSAYPAVVTVQMVENFLAGGAAINVLARLAGARLVLVDAGVQGGLSEREGLRRLGIRAGTGNFVQEPAMSLEEATRAVLGGIAIAREEAGAGADLFVPGEMGIANSTAASALVAALTGSEAEAVTGRGTGIDDAIWRHKCEVVRAGLERHGPSAADPLHALSVVGGLEIACLAGMVIGAAGAGAPVLLDGFISSTAALVAATLAPAVRRYLFAGHRSVEPGHAVVLGALGLEPLLSLDLRLGEGSGAALAIPIVRAAADILRKMATFGEAGVSEATP